MRQTTVEDVASLTGKGSRIPECKKILLAAAWQRMRRRDSHPSAGRLSRWTGLARQSMLESQVRSPGEFRVRTSVRHGRGRKNWPGSRMHILNALHAVFDAEV